MSAKMTFGEAAAIHLRNLDDNVSIKPRTRDYWRQRLDALAKSWPELSENRGAQDHASGLQEMGEYVCQNCVERRFRPR
jgi:hypothetical protein